MGNIFKKTVFGIGLLAAITGSVHADWGHANWPEGGQIYDITGNANILFAAGSGGIFRSTNNGENWVLVNTQINNIRGLIMKGSIVFAFTWDELFRSTDSGTSWAAVTPGVPSWIPFRMTGAPSCLALCDTTIIAGTWGGILLSNDNGKAWIENNSGLPDKTIKCLAVNDSTIFAGTLGAGVFRSTDNGAHWIAANIGLTDSMIWSLKTYGNMLVASAAGFSVPLMMVDTGIPYH